MRLQSFTEHIPMPWANGRGTSYEVARAGGDTWDWRVAIAPVVADGPFSELPGVDRWLVVMDAAPLELTIDGVTRTVGQRDIVSFAGESAVYAHLPSGATRDCGLMVRRGRASGSMEIVKRGVTTGRVVVALTESTVNVKSTTSELGVGDALIADESTMMDVVSGVVCVIGVDT